MSTAVERKPTSRQLNEARRIATRFGRSEWWIRADGAMVIRSWGDNPEPDEQPMTVVLDRAGLVLARTGRQRRSEPVTEVDG